MRPFILNSNRKEGEAPEILSFCEYKITALQEDILTIIGKKLQDYITRNEQIPINQMGDPCIEISCNDLGLSRKTVRLIHDCVNLLSKSIIKKIVEDNNQEETYETENFINSVRYIRGTNRIEISINPRMFDFFTNYGKGERDTNFSYKIALSLRSNYTKRIYKLICSLADSFTEYNYPIEQFRKDFIIPKSYTNTHIRDKILRPAESQIRKSNSPVWFQFELECKKPEEGKKPKADTITIAIENLPKEKKDAPYYRYMFLYRFISNIYENHEDPTLPVKIIRVISEIGKKEDAFERCFEENERILEGKQSREKGEEYIREMIETEYGIKFEKTKDGVFSVEHNADLNEM